MRIIDNSTIYLCNETLLGDNNIIYGDKNSIQGDNNKIYGNNCRINGNNNEICGRLTCMRGTNNRVMGFQSAIEIMPIPPHASSVVHPLSGYNNHGYNYNGYNYNGYNYDNDEMLDAQILSAIYPVSDHHVIDILDELDSNSQNNQNNQHNQNNQNNQNNPNIHNGISIPAAEPELECEENQTPCIICYANQVRTTVLNCGHTNMCISCARKLVLGGADKCPTCKQTIHKIIRIYQ